MNHDQLVDIIQQGRIEWSAHALKRMLDKGISRASVKHIICTGEMIKIILMTNLSQVDYSTEYGKISHCMQLLPMILPSKRYS